MEFKLHPYQEYCVQRIIDTPFIALMLEMGLGKSVITLTAFQQLKYDRFCVRKMLVVAPKKVAEDTWQSEAAKWDHLQALRFSTIMGSEPQRVAALKAEADIYVINRDNVVWLVQYCLRAFKKWLFDMVVLDESSSFKNHRTKRFKALKVIRPRVSRLVELTGTPRPNGLMDLWAQIFLLDMGQRLGKTISVYRDMWFTPGARNGQYVYEFTPRPGAAEEIYQAIADVCVAMKAEDYLTLPDLIYDDISVKLSPEAESAYKKLEREALLHVGDETITAATAAALTGKLLQLCNGAVYSEDSDGVRDVIRVHNCKLDALEETIEQLGGDHAVICYYFKHDLERITALFDANGYNYSVYEDSIDMRRWNEGKIDYLLVHPASCGYGLNLQDGGHHIIWFGLTWNLEQYQQTNARLFRQGQQHPVVVHHLIVKGGLDETVISALHRKGDAQEGLLRALRARIEAVKNDT